jgi:hypothetical protein
VAVDAFGDHPQAELPGERGQRADHRAAVMVVGRVVMDLARQLEGVEAAEQQAA